MAKAMFLPAVAMATGKGGMTDDLPWWSLHPKRMSFKARRRRWPQTYVHALRCWKPNQKLNQRQFEPPKFEGFCRKGIIGLESSPSFAGRKFQVPSIASVSIEGKPYLQAPWSPDKLRIKSCCIPPFSCGILPPPKVVHMK